MNPNLLDYAIRSKKIPAQMLISKPIEFKFQSWRLLASHLVDFWTVAAVSTMLTVFFQLSASQYMATSKMKNTILSMNFEEISFNLLPAMTLAYFFFCYFFNDGQTQGMNYSKRRVSMSRYNMAQSFLWAVRSTTIVFTFGMSFVLLKKHFQQAFKVQDHLYQDMMIEQDWGAPSLLKMADQLPPVYVQEDFKIAA